MTTVQGRLIPHRFAPSLAALFLACSVLATPAHAGWLFGGDDDAAQKAPDTSPAASNPAPAADIEGNVRQARMLRLAGQYKQAIHHLAQLMLVASDDGRVVSEYGKTLAQMGRAQDAVSFLTRASQLRADDWTIFSALGVAFDELGEQDKAKDAYERALALKPNEPSVLNNYALSRLLAHDPQGARDLASRIRNAGGQSDPKIARNLAMIADMAPAPKDSKTDDTPAKVAQSHFTVAAAPPGVPAKAAAPAPISAPAAVRPQSQPARTAAVADNASFVSLPVTPPAPAPTTRVQAPTPLPEIHTATSQPGSVVMQDVPVDPLAGPVAPRKATHQPHALAKADKKDAAQESRKPVRTAEQIRDSVPTLRLSANAY